MAFTLPWLRPWERGSWFPFPMLSLLRSLYILRAWWFVIPWDPCEFRRSNFLVSTINIRSTVNRKCYFSKLNSAHCPSFYNLQSWPKFLGTTDQDATGKHNLPSLYHHLTPKVGILGVAHVGIGWTTINIVLGVGRGGNGEGKR